MTTELKKQMQQALVADSDIVGDMRTEVVDIIVTCIDKNSTNFETSAKIIKETLDKQFGQSWQVVIGKAFSFDITSLDNTMIHCYYQGEISVLAYKS